MLIAIYQFVIYSTQVDVNWLRAFHNRLLTLQDPLALAYRMTRDIELQEPQRMSTPSPLPQMIAQQVDTNHSGTSYGWLKVLTVIGIIVILAAIAGVVLWFINQ